MFFTGKMAVARGQNSPRHFCTLALSFYQRIRFTTNLRQRQSERVILFSFFLLFSYVDHDTLFI